MTRPSLLAVLALALPALLVSSDEDTSVLRLKGGDPTRSQYEAWLFERFSNDYLMDFAIETVALRESERLGVRPTAEDIDAAYEEERKRNIDQYYRGDEERWAADIVSNGTQTLEGFARRRKHVLAPEIAMAALARLERVVTDDDVRKRYEVLYGRDQEHTAVELLFCNIYAGVDPQQEPRPSRAELKQRCRDRAVALRADWMGGKTVAELYPSTEQVKSPFVRDGVVTHYRRSMLGPELDQAIDMLDRAGEISEPVEVWDGYLVVRLVTRETVTIDSVRERLVEEILALPAHSAEIGAIRERLMSDYGVQSLID